MWRQQQQPPPPHHHHQLTHLSRTEKSGLSYPPGTYQVAFIFCPETRLFKVDFRGNKLFSVRHPVVGTFPLSLIHSLTRNDEDTM